eukprot:gene658-1326_t
MEELNCSYEKVLSNDGRPEECKAQVVPIGQISSHERQLYFLDLLDPGGSSDFWASVSKKCEETKNASGQKITQEEAIDEVRADNITDYFKTINKDPVVMMMTQWYDQYEMNVPCSQLYPGFEKQICKIAAIIINREYKRVSEHNHKVEDINEVIRCKYSCEFTLSKHPLMRKTILQLAAEGFKPRKFELQNEENTSWRNHLPEIIFSKRRKPSYKRNFLTIAKCILTNDPYTWETATDLPLELALKYRDDEMSALLINSMELKSKVRKLFETRGKDKAKVKFQEIIKDPSMTKTVVAILDSTVNKDWPHQPAKEKDGDDKLHIITDDPIRYHFYYRILDSDEQGRPAKLLKKSNDENLIPGLGLTEKLKYANNFHFDHRSISCLQALCQSDHKKAINHPTVRSLARRKWELYGKWRIRFYAFNYAVYLALMTCAGLMAVVCNDARNYDTATQKFRGFCEICTILAAMFYFVLEVDQLNKEGVLLYISDVFNWFDVGGLLGIFILIPLRLTGNNCQWTIATVAFILNFLRIYKYFPAWKSIGIYSKTLSILIKRDLLIFGIVYFIVLITFSGATFLSLRGVMDYESSNGFGAVNVSGLDDVFLRGIKALAQSQGFSANYNGYNIFSLVVILASMFIMMVFLVNILIAQLGASYGKACAEATEQYDVDKTLFVARLDDSRFKWKNLRMKHYVDGSYEYDKKIIRELMSKWDVLHSNLQK